MKRIAVALLIIVCLLLIGAGYCYLTRDLSVSFAGGKIVPAADMQSVYNNVITSASRGEAGIVLLSSKLPESASQCGFLTLASEVSNRSLLPAEWIVPRVYAVSGDVLQVESDPADIPPLSTVRMEVTLLIRSGGSTDARALRLEYYRLGEKTETEIP